MSKHHQRKKNMMRTGKLFVIGVLALSTIACSQRQTTENPVIIFQNPKILVKALLANNLIVPRFVPGGREIIFSGRLYGDLWDCIYSVPIVGGLPQKIYEVNDDLLFPSFSPDQRQVIFSQGFSRQIQLLDIVTKKVTPLPVFGNFPVILPDGNTVLYSGVIDANLRFYDLNQGRHRTVTHSYLSANLFPLITPDQGGILWFENRPQSQVRINRTDYEALNIRILQTFSEPLMALTLSPGGQWAIASRPNGEPFGFKLADSGRATISIRPDTVEPAVKMLAYAVDWSPTGQHVTYVGNTVPQFASENPFVRHGTFSGDLVVAELKWENIPDADLLQTPRIAAKPAFPPVEKTTENPVSQPKPAEPNNPPKIVSTPVENVRQGELYFYHLETVDIDLFDKLSYILVTGPSNAELMQKSGVIVWLPADTGRFEFSVAVQDDRNALDSQTFFVTVLPDEKWNQASYQPPPVKAKASDFSAGLRFLDSDGDGFLTAGEEAALQIDLRPLGGEPLDSLRLQLLSSTSVGEITIDELVIFRNCQPGKWNRMIVPLKGLPELRNRRILIRGILETKYGIQMLPANLIINGKNPGQDE